ncbi:MAG: FAD:protein FMN transferase [Gammaproteobacteria bacterium]|nr:FAD:protein FMN transferase [Gammaproteobacteria bacterium]
MASPCELLLHDVDADRAGALGEIAAREAGRIEAKYSRYRDDSVVAAIHRSRGDPAGILVDPETASLLDFARECFALSEGAFDITSGVLRRAWRFDGSARVPEADAVAALLPLVGFAKLGWQAPRLLLPIGMELDFGGLGKEYAVDRVFQLIAAETQEPFLVNFGGDLRANRATPSGPWRIGVERPESERRAAMILGLERGALTTSGDARRYLLKQGRRYGHILDPRTGWPAPGSPRSVTVAAASCVEAGLLSTLAMLQGAAAEAFLAAQGATHWILR